MMNVIYTNLPCDWDVDVHAKDYEWLPAKLKQAFIGRAMFASGWANSNFNILVTTSDTLSLIIGHIIDSNLEDEVTFTAVSEDGIVDVWLDEDYTLVNHPCFCFFSMDIYE